MLFEDAQKEAQRLEEGYRKYKFSYKGTRDDYEIHDDHPYVLALDDDYSYDGNGRSILGINLNYYDGDKSALIQSINQVDNAAGFRGFDLLSTIKQRLASDKKAFGKLNTSDKKRRYKIFKRNFPELLKYIRRYKYIDPSEVAVQNKKLAKTLKKEFPDISQKLNLTKITDKNIKKIKKQNQWVAKKIKSKHPRIAKKLTNTNLAGGINDLKKKWI